MKTSILLVDDHKIMRDGLKAILKHSDDYQVTAEAANGAEAVRICRNHDAPGIIIMDLNLPGLNGIETTSEILRYRPQAKILILSMYEDEPTIVSVLSAGARGFVLKTGSDCDLLNALRTVAQGGTYLSPTVSDGLLRSLQHRRTRHAPSGVSVIEALSARENQILRLVAQGNSNKEVAVLLNLQLQTVRGYRRTLMKKLNATNVAALTQIAINAGLLRQDSDKALKGPGPGAQAGWAETSVVSCNAVPDVARR